MPHMPFKVIMNPGDGEPTAAVLEVDVDVRTVLNVVVVVDEVDGGGGGGGE